MKTNKPMSTEEHLREQGLHLVTRLVALLRTGRSYSIGNRAFTGHLEQLLEVLRPTFTTHGRAHLVQMDGDFYLNGVRVPLRAATLRFQEQLHSELTLREIAGIEFTSTLDLAELEEFMRYFLVSEVYKGAELVSACQDAGLTGAMPVHHIVGAEHPAGLDASTTDEPAFASALRTYDTALQNAQALLSPARFARGIELRHIKRLVQPLIDASTTQEPTTVGLAWASAADEPWTHGIHVCIVSIGMGRHLGLDRQALADLGVAALLHDVGHSTLEDIPADATQRNEVMRQGVEAHPIAGLIAIARSTTLNRTSLRAMRVAFEHHACTPEGYPALPSGWKTCSASRLVAVADAFVSLLSLHGERGQRVTPYEALSHVLGLVNNGTDDALKLALVRTVGVYPPGQIVELDDLSIARALAPAADDPERPIIELLAAPSGALLQAADRLVMALPAERTIRRALPIDEWPELVAGSAAA